MLAVKLVVVHYLIYVSLAQGDLEGCKPSRNHSFLVVLLEKAATPPEDSAICNRTYGSGSVAEKECYDPFALC